MTDGAPLDETGERRGRPPLSDGQTTRVTASLAPEHLHCIRQIRQNWNLGGAPVAAVIRKALELAAEVRPSDGDMLHTEESQ